MSVKNILKIILLSNEYKEVESNNINYYYCYLLLMCMYEYIL